MPNTPRDLDPGLGDEFSVGDAIARGHSRGRMRAGDLERPFHGTRRRRPDPHAADDDKPLARDRAERQAMLSDARAYFTVAPAHAFLAGRSAAVAWSGPCPLADELCVGVLAPARAVRADGVRGLKLAPSLTSIRVLEGVRLTSPATTWAMLGGELSHSELVALGDAIVRVPRGDGGRRRPDLMLGTIAQLRAASLVPGRRHRAKLLAALDDVRVGSMSVLETDYRLLAADAGLPEPELDVEIRDAQGRLVGIADAVYREQRTIVEIEGDHHRVDRAQWERDIEKHAALVALGWEVVRLTSGHIRGRMPRGGAIVEAALRRRGWQG